MDIILTLLAWMSIGVVLTVVVGKIDPDSDVVDDAFIRMIHVAFWPLFILYYITVGMIFVTSKALDCLLVVITNCLKECKDYLLVVITYCLKEWKDKKGESN